MTQQRIIIPSPAKLAAALVGDETIRALTARNIEESAARGTVDPALMYRLQLFGAAVVVAGAPEPITTEDE